jgi:hypothetical protein
MAYSPVSSGRQLFSLSFSFGLSGGHLQQHQCYGVPLPGSAIQDEISKLILSSMQGKVSGPRNGNSALNISLPYWISVSGARRN